MLPPPQLTLWNPEDEIEDDDEQTTDINKGFRSHFYSVSNKRKHKQSSRRLLELDKDLFSNSQATGISAVVQERSMCDVFYIILGLRIAKSKTRGKVLAVTKPS